MEPTIRVQSLLGKRRRKERRCGLACEGSAPAAAAPLPDTLARRLALAYYIQRLIDHGKLRNYAHAAASLGIARARMSQLMDLLLVPSNVQESILLGTHRFEERELRKLALRARMTLNTEVLDVTPGT